MNENWKPYIDMILTERDWSWSLIGIIYLLVASIIRGWFIGSMIRAAKKNRSLYHEIKSAYLKRSIWGWIFFLIPLVTFAGMWYRDEVFPSSLRDFYIILAGLVSLFLSILLHQKAFGTCSIQIFNQALDKASGKEF